jgi:large subunit ribosomal protein L13
MTQKTPSLKTAEIAREWYVIDASTAPLGRIATQIAEKLIGKHKATFTPHIDNGDFVVVVNSDNVQLTGKKHLQKKYYRHSGYIGSLKEATLAEKLEKDSTEVIYAAVKGMIPKNKLHSDRMARLKVFPGSEHDHAAQKPKMIGEGK